MSTTTVNGVPAYVRHSPSVWQALGRALWDTLESVGHRRAQRVLRELASNYALSNPALAAQLREASRFDPQSTTKEFT